MHCDAALLTPLAHCPAMLPVSAPAQVPTELAQSPDVYDEQLTVHSAPPTPVTATLAPPSEDAAPHRSRRDCHMPPNKLNDYIVNI